MTATTDRVRTLVRAAAALRRRPDLWLTALGSYRSLVPKKWWRSRPFLPLPDSKWVRFRMVTAYGGDGTVDERGLTAGDLVLWLEWRRAWPG